MVATLHPQKRIYRVRTMPMTEAGIEVDWNRDLFVAMGDDLGAGAWSVRVQYKPMVRFIWLGALVMALGGFIAITDRRYRTRKSRPTRRVGRGAAQATVTLTRNRPCCKFIVPLALFAAARRVPVRRPAARPVATCRRR